MDMGCSRNFEQMMCRYSSVEIVLPSTLVEMIKKTEMQQYRVFFIKIVREIYCQELTLLDAKLLVDILMNREVSEYINCISISLNQLPGEELDIEFPNRKKYLLEYMRKVA